MAILILVKKPGPTSGAVLHYRDIGDYLDRAQKLATIDTGTLETIEWTVVEPNSSGDWLNLRSDFFAGFQPISSPPRGAEVMAPIFASTSLGLTTNRDAWIYASSETLLRENIQRMVNSFNSLVLSGSFDPQTLEVFSRSFR